MRDALQRAWSIGGSTVKLLGRLATDPRVDVKRRLGAGLAVLYALSPVDLVPDGVPLLGKVDDAAVALAAVQALLDGAGDDVLAEHWDGSPEDLEALRSALDTVAGSVPRRIRRLRSVLASRQAAS